MVCPSRDAGGEKRKEARGNRKGEPDTPEVRAPEAEVRALDMAAAATTWTRTCTMCLQTPIMAVWMETISQTISQLK